MPSDPPRRILAIQLRRLGDLILTTPALRALKEGWPRARITVLTERPFDDVLAGNPAVDEVLLHQRGALSSLACGAGLRRGRFDVVLDFHGNPSSARLAWQTGAPLRIGWAHRLRRLAYTRALPLSPAGPPRHTALAHLDLVRALAEAHPGRPWSESTGGPELFVTGRELADGRDLAAQAGLQPATPFLAAAPASRRAYKEWPAGSFAEVLSRFHQATGAPILLLGGPGEDAMLEAVAAGWLERLPGRTPLVARPSTVRSLIGCLAGSAAFFGPDGGARQIAEALGVPTLGLFGPQEPAVWTRLSSRHRAVSGRRSDCRIRCSRIQAPCACLAAVDPARVAAELIGLWREEVVAAAGRRAVEAPGAGGGPS